MIRIMLDAAVSEKLRALGQSAELCDPSGRTVGRFVPVLDLSEWEFDPATPEVSEEELNRRLNSNEKRYTTAEVIAYLDKL